MNIKGSQYRGSASKVNFAIQFYSDERDLFRLSDSKKIRHEHMDTFSIRVRVYNEMRTNQLD